MTVNLAALRDAAEALGVTARAAEEGRAEDARFAADRACRCAREAFGIAAEHPETGAYDMVIHAVTAELAVTP
jgi:hypothetical protein